MESDPSYAEVVLGYGLSATAAIIALFNAYVLLVFAKVSIAKRQELKRLSGQLKNAEKSSQDVPPDIHVGGYIDPVEGVWVRDPQPSEKAIRDLLS